MRRGCLGTPIGAHAAGATFVRLDSAIFDFPFLATNTGKTAFVKFQSFNQWGQAETPLTNCNAYPFVSSPYGSSAPGASAWTAIGGTLSNGGQSIPALIVTGASDNPSAQLIAFYYRPHGSGAWLNGADRAEFDDVAQHHGGGRRIPPTTSASPISSAGRWARSPLSPRTSSPVRSTPAAAALLRAPCCSILTPPAPGHTPASRAPTPTSMSRLGAPTVAATSSIRGRAISRRASSAARAPTASTPASPPRREPRPSPVRSAPPVPDGGYSHGGGSGTAGANTTVTTPAITTHGGGGATVSVAGAGGAVGTGGTTNTAGISSGAAEPPGNGRIRITART